MQGNPTTKHNLFDEINTLSRMINDILNQKQRDRYFEGIAFLHSFIEDLLKWLVFTQILWNKVERSVPVANREVEEIRGYCNQLNFNSLLNVGLIVNLINYQEFIKINSIRIERNELVHKYWLYRHKGKRHILRKKLEKLSGVSNILVKKFNKLIEDTAMDDSFFEVSTGRNFIVF